MPFYTTGECFLFFQKQFGLIVLNIIFVIVMYLCCHCFSFAGEYHCLHVTIKGFSWNWNNYPGISFCISLVRSNRSPIQYRTPPAWR